MPSERACISFSFVSHVPIKLPRPTQEDVAGVHIDHITNYLFSIDFPNRQGNFASVCDLAFYPFTHPAQSVRMAMLVGGQLQCLNHNLRDEVLT